MTAISWLISDWCLYRLIPTKHERIKSLLFAMTSYLTLVHQSHTLSNSTETCILLPTLYIINDIRSFLEYETKNSGKLGKKTYSPLKLFFLGVLISFGTFNRITFGAWILFPSFFLVQYFTKHMISSLIPISVFFLSSLAFSYADSYYYQTYPKLTVAPLNNLLYNISTENLQKHGIHARFTHVLINYPQIVGPIILLLFPFTGSYTKTTMFTSVVSAFGILSIFPHQELRFLLPAVPLLSTLVSFSNPRFQILKKYYKLALPLWLVYNSILSGFYGLFHQAGVVPSMIELKNSVISSTNDEHMSLVFWRTYPPPTWMLLDSGNDYHSNFTYVSVDDISHFLNNADDNTNSIVTLMGSSTETLYQVNDRLSTNNHSVYLITPKNAILNIPEEKYETVWETMWHLDMDHFEFDIHGINTFIPGIGIYRLLL